MTPRLPIPVLESMPASFSESRRSRQSAMGQISGTSFYESQATYDEVLKTLLARFHVHVHAAPLLRFVRVDVRHPF
jgi:hypothetical protein